MPVAKANGISINYEISGKGDPVLLLSGLGSDLKGWAFQVHAFQRHFRVLRFDNRGVGKSDSPDGPYSMLMMSQDCVALLDHLGIERAHVVGISMGGMIALEMAISHPHRVSKLVLANTLACESEESGHTAELVRVMGLPVEKQSEAVARLAFEKPLMRIILGSLMRLAKRKGWEKGYESQRAAIRGHDTLARLDRITAATLVLVGTKDRIIRPTSAEAIAVRIPNAKLVRIEGGSHVMNVEQRREFNEAIVTFLKSNG